MITTHARIVTIVIPLIVLFTLRLPPSCSLQYKNLVDSLTAASPKAKQKNQKNDYKKSINAKFQHLPQKSSGSEIVLYSYDIVARFFLLFHGFHRLSYLHYIRQNTRRKYMESYFNLIFILLRSFQAAPAGLSDPAPSAPSARRCPDTRGLTRSGSGGRYRRPSARAENPDSRQHPASHMPPVFEWINRL